MDEKGSHIRAQGQLERVILNDIEPSKKRRGIRFLLLLVVIFGLWRLAHRPGPVAAEQSSDKDGEHRRGLSEARSRMDVRAAPYQPTGERSKPHEPTGEREATNQPTGERDMPHEPTGEPETPQQKTDDGTPPQKTAEPGTPHLKLTEPRYAVKWIDSSDGGEVPHEKRDLTLKQAQREAGWLARHNRRFYPGEHAARSPFARLQVWLQCVCGRDVINSREPHTIPGEDRVCPYSGSELDRSHDVMLASH